jgi:hypothetical protein
MHILGFSPNVNDMGPDRYNATNVHYAAHEYEVITITIKCNSVSCQTLKYSNKPHTTAENRKYHCIFVLHAIISSRSHEKQMHSSTVKIIKL